MRRLQKWRCGRGCVTALSLRKQLSFQHIFESRWKVKIIIIIYGFQIFHTLGDNVTSWQNWNENSIFSSSSPYWYQLLELVFYSIKEGHESYFHTLTPRSKYAACHRQEKARFGVSAKSPPLLLPVFFVLLKKPWMTWTKQLVWNVSGSIINRRFGALIGPYFSMETFAVLTLLYLLDLSNLLHGFVNAVLM